MYTYYNTTLGFKLFYAIRIVLLILQRKITEFIIFTFKRVNYVYVVNEYNVIVSTIIRLIRLYIDELIEWNAYYNSIPMTIGFLLKK